MKKNVYFFIPRITLLLFVLLLCNCSAEDVTPTEPSKTTIDSDNSLLRTTISTSGAITIQAENYDRMSGINTQATTDSGGGSNVGWIDTGDYLEYDINVPSTGSYKFEFRVASQTNASKFDFYQNSTKLSNVNKAATGGFQTWTTTSKTVNLTAGNSTLKLLATGSGWNINWIKITPVSVSTTTSTSGTFTLTDVQIETTTNCSSSTSTTSVDATVLNNNTFSGKYSYNSSNNTYKLTSCAQDGRRTEWKLKSTKEFTLNTTKTMEYKASFSDYPSAGVTIGQVHCRGVAGRPLLRVEILNGSVKCVITDTHVKDSGNTYTSSSLVSYTSGNDLDIKVQVGGDKIIVTATTNGSTGSVTYDKNATSNTYKINNKWYESTVIDHFYFKAGVYNDSGNNSNTPDATFKSFKIY